MLLKLKLNMLKMGFLFVFFKSKTPGGGCDTSVINCIRIDVDTLGYKRVRISNSYIGRQRSGLF